jgi:hypothetical protein
MINTAWFELIPGWGKLLVVLGGAFGYIILIGIIFLWGRKTLEWFESAGFMDSTTEEDRDNMIFPFSIFWPAGIFLFLFFNLVCIISFPFRFKSEFNKMKYNLEEIKSRLGTIEGNIKDIQESSLRRKGK